MNTNDQAQFAKDMYQVPGQKPEMSAIAVPEAAEVTPVFTERQSVDIARQEISTRFEEISKELARSAAGIERPVEVQAQTAEIDPTSMELLRIGDKHVEFRDKRHARLVDTQNKRGFGKIVGTLFSSNSFDSEKSLRTKEALLHDLIEQDGKIGLLSFPPDPEVTDGRFFVLPSETHHEWFYHQTSPNRSKDFTNSYIVTKYGSQKSSTFYDQVEGRVKNVSATPDDAEMKNLLRAAVLAHEHITKKANAKPTSRRRFGSKNDDDLTA